METSRFVRLATQVSTAVTRRSAVAGLLAGALAAAITPVVDARRPVRGEHNIRGRKAIMCVNGVTTKVAKKRRKKYLKQGATRGECSPTCVPTATTCCVNSDCPSGQSCAGGVCQGPAPACSTGENCLVFLAPISNASLGGLTGADDICQNAADAAGLTGTYMAWLSDNTDTPSTHFINTANAGPYALPLVPADAGTPVLVANAFADLTSCNGGGNCLLHGIDRLADGTVAAGLPYAYTGTFADGTATPSTCDGWTTNAPGPSGTVGSILATDADWTDFNVNGGCASNIHLYCFEQPE